MAKGAFPFAFKQKVYGAPRAGPALLLIAIPSIHSHHRLVHLTSGGVLYASSMQLLIWTVTLCLCVASVTLSHDWRPARLLVANLSHTHKTRVFS